MGLCFVVWDIAIVLLFGVFSLWCFTLLCGIGVVGYVGFVVAVGGWLWR